MPHDRSRTAPGAAAPANPGAEPRDTLSRRRLFAGAGTAGALAAAATLLPGQPEPTVAAAPQPVEPPAAGGGYRLTDHVQRYYRTAKV